MADLGLSPEDLTSLFPEVAEKRFEVTKEERKELFEEAKEEAKEKPLIPFAEKIPGTSEKKYVESLKKAEKEAISNRMDHVSKIIDAPVENIGFGNVRDLALTYQLARSRYFKNRQKKFLSYYPEGDYKRVSVSFDGDSTDKLELFKYNKDDEKWKIANPYGRDWGELGRVAGTILDEQLAFDIASLTAPSLMKRSKHPVIKGAGYALEAIPPTVRVTLANFLGLKGKKLNEFLLGYGEEEFDVDDFDEVNFFKAATDLSDWSNALLAGGLYKGTSEFANYLLKGKAPGMVEMGEDIVRAAEELGLEPLVFAQLAANPIIRRMYMQSGLFIERPELIKQTQLKTLENALKKFGIGKGDGQLDFGKLKLLNDQLAKNVGNDIKLVSQGKFANLDEANVALQESLRKWNSTSIQTQNVFRNEAIKAVKESGDAASVTITGFKNTFKDQMRNFFTRYKPKDKIVKVRNEATGEIEEKVVKSKMQTYGNLPQEFQSMFQTIKKLDDTISSMKDPNLNNLKTLIKMREDLHKLTLHPDKHINSAAIKLHSHLTKILKGDKGNLVSGPNTFKHWLGILDNHMAGVENVSGLSFIKNALTKGGDPDKFVNQFMNPGGPLKITALKNMFLEGTEGAQRNGAEKAFNVFKSAWIANTFKSPDGTKIIDDFLANDPKSLEILLGPQFKSKAAKMKEIIYRQNKASDGIVAETIKGGNAKEFAQTLIDKSKGKVYQGLGKDFDEIITDLGGVNSNAANTVRYHVINGILDRARTIVDKAGKKSFSDTMDPKILRNEIRKLQANDYLMKFFDDPAAKAAGKTPPMIEDLQNFNLYTTALAGGNDVGGMIAAGAEVAEFVDKWNVPKLAFSLIKYNLIARLLSNKVTSSLLKNLDQANVLSPNNLRLINGVMMELEKDVLGTVTDSNTARDEGILFEFDLEAAGATPTRTSSINIPTEISRGSPESNRVASANADMFGPVGMGREPPVPPMAQRASIDPNRAAFAFGPDDILAQQRPQYAAQG